MRRLAIFLASLIFLSCTPAPSTHDACPIPDARGDLPSCMPTTLSPAAIPAFPPSLSAPTDGDVCNAASNNGPDQALLDGIEASRILLRRGLASKMTLRSVNGSSVVTGTTSGIVVTVGGTWKVYGPIPSQTFTVADLDGGGVFSDSTFYYMYLSVEAGVLTRHISTTGPDASNYYKSGVGGTDQAYVGHFRMNLGSNIVVFSAVNGVYEYLTLDTSTSITGTGPTTLDLYTLKLIPPTSRRVVATCKRTTGTSNTVDVDISFYPFDTASADIRETILITHTTKDGAGNTRSMPEHGTRFTVDTSIDGKIKYEATSNDYASGVFRSIGCVEH